MTQPRHHISHAIGLGPRRDVGTINHDNRQAKGTGGFDLGIGTGAACILGYDQINAMVLHQRAIVLCRKRAARHQHMVIGKRRRTAGRINQTQQIEMLRIGGEVVQMHASDRQHDTRRRAVKGSHRTVNVGHMGPGIAGLCRPRRTGQRDQWHVCSSASGDGIMAHLGGKRMGGINHMGHGMRRDIVAQPLYSAKTTDTLGQWLAFGSLYTTCETDGPGQPRCSDGSAKRRGLGCAPKDQKVDLHV